jgi:pseudouridine-5'-phosphate glycosidase
MSEIVETSEEVAAALAEGRPVVALESTIIAHGMSYPANVATALDVEALIRSEGAIPATIAVLDGKLRAGLNHDQIEHLGRQGARMPKLSSRDLGFAVATGSDGATTVASTMRIAAMAGIRIFATGGIGGVHRGVAEAFDVSADLTELARTPVAVVSAGAKAILDLPLTLEWLETLSVPVVGYGTDEFPAFYSRSSGLSLHMRCDEPVEMAALLATHWRLGAPSGVLIANPIPADQEIPVSEIAPVIEKAVTEAKRQAITGKNVTPFLLARLASATAGRSLVANIALVKNNARVAARIASALCART